MLPGCSYIADEAHVEFCQALFLITFPMAIVFCLSLRLAGRLRANGTSGEDLCRAINRHRIVVQAIGVLSITVTATCGDAAEFQCLAAWLIGFGLTVAPGGLRQAHDPASPPSCPVRCARRL
jgi:hypothetical protein